MHTKEDPTDILGRIEEVVNGSLRDPYLGHDGAIKAAQRAINAIEQIDDAETGGGEMTLIASKLVFAAGVLARLAIQIDPPTEVSDS